MVGTKNNSRFRTTELNIQKSLITLVNKQKISTVSITDICQNANITRGTFYKHYASVNSCMLAMEDNMEVQFDCVIERQPQITDIRTLIEEFLSIVEDNVDVIHFIFSQDPDYLSKLLLKIRRKFFNIFVNDRAQLDQTERNYIYEYSVAGTVGIIRHWINTGLKEDKQYIAQFIINWVYVP